MMNAKQTFMVFFALLFVLLVAHQSYAQRGRLGREMDPPPMDRIEQFKKVKLMEELKLSEEESIKFFSRYNAHQNEMREINKHRKAAADDLSAMLGRGATDAEYEKAISQLLDYDIKIYEARKKFLSSLKEVFPQEKIAEYIIFERNFEREVRDILRDMQQQRLRNKP